MESRESSREDLDERELVTTREYRKLLIVLRTRGRNTHVGVRHLHRSCDISDDAYAFSVVGFGDGERFCKGLALIPSASQGPDGLLAEPVHTLLPLCYVYSSAIRVAVKERTRTCQSHETLMTILNHHNTIRLAYSGGVSARVKWS